MAWERLRRLAEWLASTPATDGHEPREPRQRCPICDAEVNGWPGMRMPQLQGYWAPSREELIAHCPTHGKRPYNAPDH